ncbi:fimbria/pilus periplasmic chaperone [Marinagarivorans algicola]|uniref:fimbria/pilus periplasmic chaperone n=1 Tax=Marinagarivorans algicola TaxID=1513270 RepID=UPI0006B978B4|nr:fimbria/pilus periplasmic chaperone [Marinagarivorans algicola]
MPIIKIVALMSIVLLSYSSLALQLNPSSYQLAPKGSLATHVFEVVNDSNEIIAIKASIVTREWIGNKEHNNTTTQFEIFPAQLILKPQEKKGVRVRWAGDKTIQVEQAFRLIVEQLPVNFTQEQQVSGMKVLHKVVGALYVTPNNLKPQLAFDKVQKIIDAQKGPLLVFDVTNNGGVHSLLNKHHIVVQGHNRLVLAPEWFGKLPTQNVLAGSVLTVELPWPKALTITPQKPLIVSEP